MQLFDVKTSVEDGSRRTLRIACHQRSDLGHGCHVMFPGDFILRERTFDKPRNFVLRGAVDAGKDCQHHADFDLWEECRDNPKSHGCSGQPTKYVESCANYKVCASNYLGKQWWCMPGSYD